MLPEMTAAVRADRDCRRQTKLFATLWPVRKRALLGCSNISIGFWRLDAASLAR